MGLELSVQSIYNLQFSMPDRSAVSDLTIRTNSKTNSETFICLFLHAFVLCDIYTVLKSIKSSNPKNPEKPDDFRFELLDVDGRADPLVVY